jgi:hypothetical protein
VIGPELVLDERLAGPASAANGLEILMMSLSDRIDREHPQVNLSEVWG